MPVCEKCIPLRVPKVFSFCPLSRPITYQLRFHGGDFRNRSACARSATPHLRAPHGSIESIAFNILSPSSLEVYKPTLHQCLAGRLGGVMLRKSDDHGRRPDACGRNGNRAGSHRSRRRGSCRSDGRADRRCVLRAVELRDRAQVPQLRSWRRGNHHKSEFAGSVSRVMSRWQDCACVRT